MIKVKELYKLYLDSVGNRQIETVADKYISSLNAIKISARGYHFFIPKQYMGYIDDFEDFMEELSGMNLYAPTNKATRKEISINSMYVADDEKQQKKRWLRSSICICRSRYRIIRIKLKN